MKAVYCTRYGGPDVLEIRDVPKPVPKDGEILVRIHATTVNSGDTRIRAMKAPAGFGIPMRLMFGVLKPRNLVLGTNCAGVVEAVGGGVTKYSPGDRVAVAPGASLGCHAEYCLVAEKKTAIAPIPEGISFEDAAAVIFGGTAALSFLRDRADLKAGETVLVNGASGAVGSSCVQIAKYFGAHVTGVSSAASGDFVRSLGADEVIDYTQTDFLRTGKRYDVIVDTVGNAPFSRSADALTDRGRLLMIVATLREMLKAPLQSKKNGKRAIAGVASEKSTDIALLMSLLQTGQLRPLIDQAYPLERIAEAHAHVDTGHKRGNVVITVDNGS